MTVAVISGTTSGLGRQYVDAIMTECPEVDEIWMIARRETRLKQIAATYPTMHFKLITMDLAVPENYVTLQAFFQTHQPTISALISNAGVAFNGDVIDTPLSQLLTMINLNVAGSTALTKIALPYVQSGGFILQVASVSSFVPNPHQAVYSSTKAYIASFALSLRQELKGRNINVCAAMPGRMKTEMDDMLNKTGREGVFELVPSLNIPKFAHRTIQAAKRGQSSYTMNWFYKTFRVVAKLVPHSFLVRFTGV
ncbi:hypothetical protein FC83_GL001662 [Agrilactobacillus composti DSM 18527 = JCM 14202]|uniref:Uncharacterized protein n=1 Tax=Agrilactobacillus composti DSM 18527 = JCM 14202 TaxID=1423734 RepID=X0PNA7_9LACO|nr:SDR family NAD(P)-dependent oxidoreductase [Agrilactobacillus composti]KRM30528.1 hypothetical protein FC83_GL001662 [Agrilactobacillus composti DSM 18527 = JCM 14202]GAF38406.1 probable short-chain dehydrogenase [Agrilactobacillus composti DSM 18527 = JCM 14202]